MNTTTRATTLVVLAALANASCSVTLYETEWDRRDDLSQAECDEYPETAEPVGCKRYHWK